MNKFLSLLIGVAISFHAVAADDRPDRKLSLEYLKASKVEQVINASIDTYAQQLSQTEAAQGLSAADRAMLKSIMTETMGWETIKPQLVELVGNVYTKAEIRAAMAYMRTKEGASMTAKQEEFSRQFATILSRNLDKAVAKCLEQTKAIQQERRPEE